MSTASLQLGDLASKLRGAPEDEILDAFIDYVSASGKSLYAAQEEAIIELFAGRHVILNTPTGSGKSLVAEAFHFLAIALQKRSFYTSPIKALVSEKFFAWCRLFGARNVGMMTGDASINKDAPVVCCTAEVLSNLALAEGKSADVDFATMDEFHYYSDRDRGVAWQVPLLLLTRARFLLMSATMGDTTVFTRTLEQKTGVGAAVVRSTERPVPLEFTYAETPLHETIASLVESNDAPVYVVHFTQRSAAESAQSLMSVDVCSKEEKAAITQALYGTRFDTPHGRVVARHLKHGIGVHHAGLLPKYRLAVEKLAQAGLLKVICGTDTLGVGINVPIRTVLFTQLCKFDGERVAILSARDFHQIAGRAGRRGFDERGRVVVQAPEHVIENFRLEAKAESSGRKKKVVKRKPPERGYAHWSAETFERLKTAEPEPLVSRFSVGHGMLLQVLRRDDGGCMAMARLVRDSHENARSKRAIGRHVLALHRSLVDAGIVEVDSAGRRLGVSDDLQDDFSLHHSLSLYLVDSIRWLDAQAEEYAVDLLSVAEAIAENPDVILMRQLDRIKRDKLIEMKAAGIEYDERMEELERLEYPKPNRDLIYESFNAFAKDHPWVGAENVRPKSIAREMFEQSYSFSEYVKEYGLERVEGTLLRYLSSIYKILRQTVPYTARTRELDEITDFVETIVRQVDSSLIDEWESLHAPDEAMREREREGDGESKALLTDRALKVAIRNTLSRVLRALARRDIESLVDAFGDPPEGAGEIARWGPREWAAKLDAFFESHAIVRVDADARGPDAQRIVQDERAWAAVQSLLDDDGPTGWELEIAVDVAASRAAGSPVAYVVRFDG